MLVYLAIFCSKHRLYTGLFKYIFKAKHRLKAQHDMVTAFIDNGISADTNHFAAFFKHATMGIVVTAGEGNIAAINPFALNEFGYKEQELLGRNMEILIPHRFRKRHIMHRKDFEKIPHNRPVGFGLDLIAVRKNGTEFPVEVSLGKYKSDHENFVIAFITNISVRKKAEAEINELKDKLEAIVAQRTKDLTETLEKLEISNTRLEAALAFQKAVLDNAGAMIIATDEKGIIKLFNPEAAANIGYSSNDVINRKTPVLFHDKVEIENKRMELQKEFGVAIADDFSVLVEKARHNTHEEEQYTYIRQNGSRFPVSLTITAIRNSEGLITGFMGVAIDISERKKTEEQLLESLVKEKELSELKSRFVSLASHEFRTPLSTVLSSAYLIEKYNSAEDQPKREKHLMRIISSINMLTDILNDFLSVGKIEEGKIPVRFTEFDIHELVGSVVSELKVSLKKQQKIFYNHDGNLKVLLDASLLKHIVMNLVSNAGKFSSEASVINVDTICRDNMVVLSVKDEGIGIGKEDQRHLMERFYRGANAANIQGTGLGLYIVSKYAELMHGTVEFTSELGKGSKFIIKFMQTGRHEKDFAD